MANLRSVSSTLSTRRRAAFARTLRCLMVFCAIFYAVLPSFTYCRCAGRCYVGAVQCCGAKRAVARTMKKCCRGRCSGQDVSSSESQRPIPPREGCCRVFVKSFYMGGDDVAQSREVRLDYLGDSLLDLDRAHTTALLAGTTLAFYARCKPPRPLYLILLVLRN